MAAVDKLTIRFLFQDQTTATFTVDNIKTNIIDIQSVKNKITAFNNASGGELASKIKSKNGFNCVGINRAVVTTTNRVYIF